MQAKIDEGQARGMAIGVCRSKEVVWKAGFGKTGHTKGEKAVDTKTNFGVMSLSKLMTAMAVMKAQQGDYLDIDKPISTYLPNLKLISEHDIGPEKHITTRHLLCHTAGFSHFVDDFQSYETKTRNDYVHAILSEPLTSKIGDKSSYSNSGYDLAGHILAEVYGKSYETSMNELLFQPLGMTHSTFEYDRVKEDNERALGYDSNTPVLPETIPCFASGGAFSNIDDMMIFLGMILSKGKLKDSVYLDEGSFNRIFTPRGLSERRASNGYALGIFKGRNRFNGRAFPVFVHTGEGWGYTCDLFFCFELDLGIVILTNQGGLGMRWRGQITDDLYDILLSPPLVKQN